MYTPNRNMIPDDHQNPHIRHHHHLPPPPPPPLHLPPPPAYPSLPLVPPPPPPYNPHQSQFTFLNYHGQPLFEDFSNNHPQFHPLPMPRLSSRIVFEEDNNLNRNRESDRPYPSHHPDSWGGPPRLPPNHHHQPMSPFLPANSYNRDLEEERNYRYRDKHIDGFIGNLHHNQQPLMDQNDRNKRALQYSLNPDKAYDSVVKDEKPQNSRDEEWTWLHIDSPNGKKGHEVESTKENSSVLTKRTLNGHNSGKSNNRAKDARAKDAREEFFGPQKKQTPKKSAFLRIGKPNHKNKKTDPFSKSYFDDSNTSSFRAKDKDHLREVHDVSSKSSLLVAKAISSPSDQSVVPIKNLSSSLKRALQNADVSPKTKFVRRVIKLDHLLKGTDPPSSSDKGVKDSPEKVKVSSNASLCDIGSLVPSSSGTENPAAITNVEIDPIKSQSEINHPLLQNTEELKTDEASTSKFESDTINSHSEIHKIGIEICATTSQGVNTDSGDCFVDDSNNVSRLDHPYLPLEATADVEVPPITNVFADTVVPTIDKKRKLKDIESGFSSLSTSETPLTVVNSVVDRDIATLPHPVTNLDSTEQDVISSILVNTCSDPQTCNDDICVSEGCVQVEGSTEVDLSTRGEISGSPDVIPPNNNKKRKASANQETQSYEKKVDDTILVQEKVDVKLVQEKVHDRKLGQAKVTAIKPVQSKFVDIKLGQEKVDDKKLDQEKITIPSKGILSLSSTKKNIPNSAFPRVITGLSSSIFSRKINSATQNLKPRTWHRIDNTSVSLPHKIPESSPAPTAKLSPRKNGTIQGPAYVRKGHSLVRKPDTSSSSVYRLKSTIVVESKKSSTPENKNDGSRSPIFLITGIERPNTPPLINSTKLLDCETSSTTDMTVLPPENLPANSGSETTSGSIEFTENGADSVNNGSQTMINGAGKIRYVKRKANQLVAATNNSDLSVEDVDRSQAKASEGYYKRRKNQIVRTTTACQTQSNQEVLNFIPIKSFSKKQFGKGSKMYKLSKFSPVWRLGKTQSSGSYTSQRQKIWPNLFPWKRATYLRSFMQKSPPVFTDRSLSTISQKLLLSRKRDTVYTRSTHGFSLRISKLLSVGGSSLKWSKSIERNSKKANEEATLAVAAVEKKKREEGGAARKPAHTIKPRPGARIYRIGAVRYKMDPTKRTLQRIPDEKESSSSSIQSEKNAKKPYIPRRLVIGNDEYVRLGNGNQLIRDPKKRTRILASEKVRWSLHTARLRLAKKTKYCQFFTRFGTCNKHDDGKCPYNHDRSKIAVCTKFLCGSCSNPNCKLTHQVIPERMQDCSYFLQGICSNEQCAYRHVHVNPNASVCEGFLKGYCSDGNECKKKHTYVCPIFEETGKCLEGSSCKLHHPKIRTKSRKNKPTMNENYGKGRYFAEQRITQGIENHHHHHHNKNLKKNAEDVFFQEGKFVDYVTLDVTDDGDENDDIGLRSEERNPVSDNITSRTDIGEVHISKLIKPIKLLSKDLRTQTPAPLEGSLTL